MAIFRAQKGTRPLPEVLVCLTGQSQHQPLGSAQQRQGQEAGHALQPAEVPGRLGSRREREQLPAQGQQRRTVEDRGGRARGNARADQGLPCGVEHVRESVCETQAI